MIYLDNNATTPLDPDVLEEMQRVAGSAWGNPGSRHVAGRRARQVLENAREEIAGLLDAHPDEVIFTSGGTESSNLAIGGLTAGRQGTIALPAGEHPAVHETVSDLEKQGFRRLTLELDSSGLLKEEQLRNLPWGDVVLTTALLAHNETGVIQDLGPLAELCQEHDIPLHVDAVQAVGKIDVSFRQLGATTLSAGAHKFHGPRGIGVLLVQRDCGLVPRSFGGHQEGGLRPGTEPVMLAAGMACALRKYHQNRDHRTTVVRELRDRLQQGLEQTCAPVIVHGSQANRLPNTLNMAFPGCDADALLVALDLAGVCCSHGSACASGSAEPAPVLLAMGCSRDIARSSIRLSLGIQNTRDEIDRAIAAISGTVERQRRFSARPT